MREPNFLHVHMLQCMDKGVSDSLSPGLKLPCFFFLQTDFLETGCCLYQIMMFGSPKEKFIIHYSVGGTDVAIEPLDIAELIVINC